MAGKIQSAVAECFEHKIGGAIPLIISCFWRAFRTFFRIQKKKKAL